MTPRKDDSAATDLATTELAVAVADARKPPHEWAIAKGLLKLNPDGSIHYKTHTPWQYHAARVMQKWCDPTIDPTFTVTEAEFDAAIKAVP